MTLHGFFADLVEPDPFDRCRRAREVFLDEFCRKAHGVEDLRAAIGLISRDAHLGHHFQDTFADGLDVILLHLFRGELDAFALADLFERLEGKIRVDCLGAIAGERAEVMHFARFARFNDKSDLHAQALADQLVVNR